MAQPPYVPVPPAPIADPVDLQPTLTRAQRLAVGRDAFAARTQRQPDGRAFPSRSP